MGLLRSKGILLLFAKKKDEEKTDCVFFLMNWFLQPEGGRDSDNEIMI